MALITGELSRMSGASGNNGWVKELNISNQSRGIQDASSMKEETASIKGKGVDHIEISGVVPLDPQFGQNIERALDSQFVVRGRQDFVSFTGGEVSKKAQELAALMAEEPTGVEFSIDGFSMEQILPNFLVG